jgi:hypothetical protein
MMIRSISILIFAALGAPLSAQQLDQLEFPEDPRHLVSSDITVDLTRLAEDEPEPGPAAETQEEKADAEASSPGEEPEADEPTETAPANPETAPEQAAESDRGVQVSVSSVSGPLEKVEPDQITIKAPFPAKPLSQTPPGWKMVPSKDPEAGFEKEVEIAPGTGMKLAIRPHVLVPDADGATAFGVTEPGFDPSLQYRQNGTVGCLLGQSIRHLKEDEAKLGEAIDRLEQLLVSLPDQEP